MNTKQQHGGARPGAGRPPSPDRADKMITVKVTEAQREAFHAMGGSAWLKTLLDEARRAK